jgi:predicted GNAT family acetyltransferase
MAIEVRDEPQHSRYEIVVDGELAGFAEYEREDGKLAFVHTEIDQSHQGQGLAGKLISAALEGTRQAGLQVRPYCRFVRSYIASHDDVLDLVAPDDRVRFDLDASKD